MHLKHYPLPLNSTQSLLHCQFGYRHLLATKLGYKSYVDFVLERTMAGRMDNIVSVLDM